MQDVSYITNGRARIVPDIRYPGKGWVGFVPPVTGDAFCFDEKDGYYWVEIYQSSGDNYTVTVSDVSASAGTMSISEDIIKNLYVGMRMIAPSYLEDGTEILSIDGNVVFFSPNEIIPSEDFNVTFSGNIFDTGLYISSSHLKATELWFFPKGSYNTNSTIWGYQSENFKEGDDYFESISRRPYDPNDINYINIQQSGRKISSESELGNGYLINPRYPVGIKVYDAYSNADFYSYQLSGILENYNNKNDQYIGSFNGFSGKFLGYTFESGLNNGYKMYCSGIFYAPNPSVSFSSWTNCSTDTRIPHYGDSPQEYVSGEFYFIADGKIDPEEFLTRNATGTDAPFDWSSETAFVRPPKIVQNSNGTWSCKIGDMVAQNYIPRNPYIDIRIADFYSSESGLQIFKATGDTSSEYILYAEFDSTLVDLKRGEYNYSSYADLHHENLAEFRGFINNSHEDFDAELSSITGVEKQFIFRDYEFNPGQLTFYKSRVFKINHDSTRSYSPFAFHENSTFPKVIPTGYTYPSVMVVDSDNPDNRFYAVCHFSDNEPIYGVSSYVSLPDWKYSAKIIKRCQDVVLFSVGTGIGPDGEPTDDSKGGRYQADGWSFLRFYKEESHNSNEVEKFLPIRFMSGNSQNPSTLLASAPDDDLSIFPAESMDPREDPYSED